MISLDPIKQFIILGPCRNVIRLEEMDLNHHILPSEVHNFPGEVQLSNIKTICPVSIVIRKEIYFHLCLIYLRDVH